MNPLGIAVLSFAHAHAGGYCEAMRAFDDARLVAIWDDNAARGQAAAANYEVDFSTDLAAVLNRDDVDAVIVTAETNRHADIVEAACRAGKHILCQKPMATTSEDCDRIIAAVEQSGVHFQMAFQMRCDPLNQKIKEWVDAGAVGNVGVVRRRHCINFLFAPGLKDGPHAWHVDPIQNVGMFFDDAVHATDFLLWLLGRPVSVMAEIDNVLTDVAPDDTGLAIYRWESGAMGDLLNSAVTLAGQNTCEVYGDEGVIIQNYDDQVSTAHAAPGEPALKLWRRATGAWETFDYPVPTSHGERIRAVPRSWIDNLLGDVPSAITARDGKDSVEMCLAAYESARSGKRVPIG